jgi:hypothetical protein
MDMSKEHALQEAHKYFRNRTGNEEIQLREIIGAALAAAAPQEQVKPHNLPPRAPGYDEHPQMAKTQGNLAAPVAPQDKLREAQQRVEIVERMMKLPYIKQTRNAEVGPERFVCRDDVITLIHEYAKELRAAALRSIEPAPAKEEK